MQEKARGTKDKLSKHKESESGKQYLQFTTLDVKFVMSGMYLYFVTLF